MSFFTSGVVTGEFYLHYLRFPPVGGPICFFFNVDTYEELSGIGTIGSRTLCEVGLFFYRQACNHHVEVIYRIKRVRPSYKGGRNIRRTVPYSYKR